jgi:putative toxin-antitoxin system antitoxin component (TIGR02293 family)
MAEVRQVSAGAVVAALGGRKVLKGRVHSDLDLALAVEEGLPTAAAYRLVSDGLLAADELYDLVISRRTFERRKNEKEPLSSDESDKLLRVVRVIVQAIETLGDAAKAREWLRKPNRALRQETPLSRLKTDVGARMVEQMLGRIAYGVYS